MIINLKIKKMNLARNFWDLSKSPKNKTRNLVTTISGIVLLVITILASFGVLTPGQSSELQQHATSFIGLVEAAIKIIAAVILMFKATDA